MNKERLLELAGLKPLHEAWGEGFEQPGAESDDMSDQLGGNDSEGMTRYNDAVKTSLQTWIQRAARTAKREGMSKEEFDHSVLEMVDSVWSQMQTVRTRGERVGSTPRF